MKINRVTMCERIAVQPPYFAFSELEVEGPTVRGVFAAEQQVGHEVGAVCTAEVGRHLAILGSCAAVLASPLEGPYYYLASQATLSMWRGAEPCEGYQAIAQVVSHDKRSVAIRATVEDKAPFAHLYCEYKVLSEALFKKTFAAYQTEPVAQPDSSPYRQSVNLAYDRPEGNSLTAHSLPLSISSVAGHFPCFPTWPVAIIADTVAQVRSRLLQHLLGREAYYRVTHVTITAKHLVSAKEALVFHVTCCFASIALSRFAFTARVCRGEEVVVSMEMEVYL